ncbi:GDP-mannose 4,6-dehydratase, partial [Allorhizocola rhizosphaerae]|uniref:GDP-mannose 4,6-dehydratase n=1 Tax=Allorhizocola rhizosphaerae TaxID=1872709 RepID=UPI00319E5F0B
MVSVRLRAQAHRRTGEETQQQLGRKSQGEDRKVTKVLITGSAGFIGGYVVEDMLKRGYQVVGLDNYSKYGPVAKSYDKDPNYRFVEGDA